MTDPTRAPRPPEPLPERSSENAAPGEGGEPGETGADLKQDMDSADRANGEPDATDGGPGSGG